MTARPTRTAVVRGLVLACAVLPGLPRVASAQAYSCERIEGERHYECLGAIRGAPRIVAELRSTTDDGRLSDLAELAARLDLQRAVPALRARLGAVAPRVGADVAHALATLGDAGSAEAIRTLARQTEGHHSSAWERAVDALERLGPQAALPYAREVIGRMSDPGAAWFETLLSRVLPILVDGGATDALLALKGWTNERGVLRDMFYARVMGARMRLGDEPLLGPMRVALGTRNATVPVEPSHYVGGLGDHPDDVPALVRFAGDTGREGRAAYDAILRFIARAEARGEDRAWARARRDLERGLVGLTPHREDRAHVQFEARPLARHHAALARLGHAPSRTRLLELTDEDPTTVIPWIAARHALALGLPGAVDRAAAVVARGMAPGGRDRTWEERVRLLDAFAEAHPEDARWAVALLDRHPRVRDRALHQVARRRPASACRVVPEHARRIQDTLWNAQVRHAMMALTVLGDACRDEIERAATDDAAPPVFRGMVIELLAVLRSDRLEATMRRWGDDRDLGWSPTRARQIAAAR